jgi:hypothetical protein
VNEQRAANELFGPPAATFVAIMVALVAAGTVSANVFIISRLTETTSKKGYIPAMFAKRLNLSNYNLDTFLTQLSTLLSRDRRSQRRYRAIVPQADSIFSAADTATHAAIDSGVPM